jgi:uncharacterized protein (TIGR03083 family)
MTQTSTALPRPQVGLGLLAEYEAFADLVGSLTETEWATPSRCDGCDVRDVAGHVIGLAEDTAAGKPGSRNFAEEAADVRDDTPANAAARLRVALGPITALVDAADDAMWDAPVGVADLTLGQGVLLLWYDAFVHADDIRAAVGRASQPGPGLDASVVYVLTELDKRGFDTDGLPGEIDAMQFVLAATGRTDAAALGLDPSVNIYAE